MRPRYILPALLLSFLALIPVLSQRVAGQSSRAQSRITQPVEEAKLVTLRGNVHPLARAEYDRGAAPASLSMDHMMLVLTRSQEQQSALDMLLAQQQDRSSPNYHKWLTAEQFGQQFGPSDQDIQKLTSWLESQGFHVNNVANGRTTVDFSGTASQVQQAFHTAMHRYVFPNGDQHWANASNPQIPEALATVVAGVSSLNNFPRKRMSHSSGVVRRSMTTGESTRISPQFTYAGGCNGTNTNCFAIGPADFATIYNVPSTINGVIAGTGQTIAIVSDSDINTSDVTFFRSIFGLPAINLQRVVPSGAANPGVEFGGSNGNNDEEEAALDVEWAGAVAPGATIDLVISATTTTSFGGDTSALFVVNCQVVSSGCPTALPAPASILSYSYGACELFLGTSGNAFYQQLWSQAAAEGITVLVSSGDSGSAGCDDPSATLPAVYGLAVNGVGSTPYNVAVGGTDFNDLTNPGTYFTNTSGTLNSAISYIPETAWNDSCSNSLIYAAPNNIFGIGSFTSAVAACNSNSVQNARFVQTVGGSGGVSNCTTSSATANAVGSQVASCGGGYAKPSWQTGPGVPNDGKRDVPDISLFAGDGVIQNFYVVCQQDLAASLTNTAIASCSPNSPYVHFVTAGGTSVSVQAFAGVVALINQKTGSSQGNLNPTLYALAAGQSASTVFHDITSGTIAMPCTPVTGVPNCTPPSSFQVGVLSGFSAGIGFDLATGLGSVNVANLVNNVGPNFYLSSSSPVVTVPSPGASGTMTVTAYPVKGYTGTVTLTCSGLPTGATCSFNPASVVFTSSTSATTGIPVTVTVTTTAASFGGPTGGFWNTGRPAKMAEVAFAMALFLVGLLAYSHPKRLRWSAAVMIALFAVVGGITACGGGSSSSTSKPAPPTGSTAATLTGTAGAGSMTSSMPFTVTIQ